jgi:hypothetical protein
LHDGQRQRLAPSRTRNVTPISATLVASSWSISDVRSLLRSRDESLKLGVRDELADVKKLAARDLHRRLQDGEFVRVLEDL